MEVVVFNAPNTLNYGSMMMAENLFYYLWLETNKRDIQFRVVTPKSSETVQRMRMALPFSQIQLDAVRPAEVLAGSRVGRAFALTTGLTLRRRVGQSVRSSDGIVVLGGDDFTEDYGSIYPMASLLKLARLTAMNKRVYMIGQTIGPFFSWRKMAARRFLRNIDLIITRDRTTTSYLGDELGLHNVLPSYDLAFLPLARQDDPWISGIQGSYFVVVPSELLWRYSGDADRDRYIAFLADLVLEVVTRYLPTSSIVLLPHVLAPDFVDDRSAARDLRTALQRRGVDLPRIHMVEDPILPFQARRILAESELVITGRMHAAVSSLACSTPALALAYSGKFRGVLEESLGIKDVVVDVRGRSWAQVQNLCLSHLERLFSGQYDPLRDHLIQRVPVVQQAALKGIRRLASLIG